MSSETPPQELARRIETLESRVEELESAGTRQADRLDELDAGLQAVRGFLGGVDAVNEAVERRADTAIAAVERLEAEVDARDQDGTSLEGPEHGSDEPGNDEDADEAQNDPGDGATAPNSLRARLRTLR